LIEPLCVMVAYVESDVQKHTPK